MIWLPVRVTALRYVGSCPDAAHNSHSAPFEPDQDCQPPQFSVHCELLTSFLSSYFHFLSHHLTLNCAVGASNTQWELATMGTDSINQVKPTNHACIIVPFSRTGSDSVSSSWALPWRRYSGKWVRRGL